MKNYILNKQQLKEILLQHKTFFSNKVKDLIAKGIDISKLTYRETNKFTDEFIEKIIDDLPIDSLLDQVDEVMQQTVGYTSKEVIEERKKWKESYENSL